MRSVRVVLITGLALTALAVGIVLTRSPPQVVATNGIPFSHIIAIAPADGNACQSDELLPAHTTAIRIALAADLGPRVKVEVLAGGPPVTGGERGAGWGAGTVTVHVRPLPRALTNATVCLSFTGAYERVDFYGKLTPARVAATSSEGRLAGRLRIEYLRSGHSTWWSLATAVAKRMGLGRAWPGAWVALLVLALMAALVTLTVRATMTAGATPPVAPGRSRHAPHAAPDRLARALRRVPTAAWLCAGVACLNAVCWSFIVPPFQLPDEPSHFAYVEELVHAGRTPTSSGETFASDEMTALLAVHWAKVKRQPANRTIASGSEQRTLERELHSRAGTSHRGLGAGGVAASQPPAYYALAAIPYALGAGGGVLAQLQLMRLLSALLAGVTVLFVFLFLREALPALPWTWTLGGLCAALTPLLASNSSGVNPDALLFAVAAACFYCLARGFRRGLTPRLAAAAGALITLGLLTKLNFIGLVPGLALGLVLLALRTQRSRARALRLFALALALAAAPVCVYVLVNVLSGRSALGSASRIIASHAHSRSLSGELSFIWQLYLPRLPGMQHDFADVMPLRDIWFDGLVGQYGWLDTFFPGWAYDLALIPALGVAALCIRALVLGRAALQRRAGELCAYAAIALGLLIAIGASAYAYFPAEAAGFPEPRYLLPLLAPAAAALVLAARGAGRRWAATVGALLVVLFLAYDVLSQLQVIARYYG
jgi:hypothetical protein